MAENKKDGQNVAPVQAPRSSTAREVLAARMKNIEDRGIMTPALQRQVDRMIVNVERARKK